MALPQEIRDEIVREHGYDPTQWDVAEDFSSFIPKQTPSIPQQPAETVGAGISTIPKLALSAPPTANTPLQTFGKTFLHEAPSAIGGGAAAAGTLAALGGTASLTGAGALAGIPLMIAGGYLGARGVRSIQEAVEPESWRLSAEQAAAENPTAALLGGVATMPLSGFRPGRSTIDALKGGAKLLGSGLERTPAETAAMLNAAINAGLQPATEVAIAQAEGRPLPSAKELALSALLGATFTTPVGPYKKVFPEVNAPRRLDVGTKGAVTIEEQQRLLKALAEEAQFKAKKDAEYVKMQEEKLAQDLAEQQKIKTTLDAVDVEKLKAENAARALELQQQMGPKFGAAEARPKPRVVTETGKEIYPDYTGVSEQNKTEVASESPADLRARREEARLAGEEEPKFQPKSALTEEQNISQQLAERGLTGSPSAVMYQKFKDWGADLAGIKLEQDGTITDAQGNSVAGALIAKKGTNELLSKINPDKAGLDTIPHEMLGHGFLRRLRESPRKSDQEFVRKFEELVSKDSEYQRLKAQDANYDPEEFIASKQGLEFIKDRVLGRGETEAKEFWRDLTAHIKTRFTKNATMEDFRRIFNYRGINQPKVKVTGMREGRVVNARTQPETQLGPERQRYEEIQSQMRALMQAGDMDSPEFIALFKEMEQIKNRSNKGFPPEQRNQPASPLDRSVVSADDLLKNSVLHTVRDESEIPSIIKHGLRRGSNVTMDGTKENQSLGQGVTLVYDKSHVTAEAKGYNPNDGIVTMQKAAKPKAILVETGDLIERPAITMDELSDKITKLQDRQSKIRAEFEDKEKQMLAEYKSKLDNIKVENINPTEIRLSTDATTEHRTGAYDPRTGGNREITVTTPGKSLVYKLKEYDGQLWIETPKHEMRSLQNEAQFVDEAKKLFAQTELDIKDPTDVPYIQLMRRGRDFRTEQELNEAYNLLDVMLEKNVDSLPASGVDEYINSLNLPKDIPTFRYEADENGSIIPSSLKRIVADSRYQPSSSLRPEDERALKLRAKQEGRTPYPFTEKERQGAERFLDREVANTQEAIDSDLETGSDLTPETAARINKLDQLPLGDEDFQRNQPESALLDSGAARFLEQEDISGFKLGSAYPSKQFIGRLKNKVNPTEWNLLEDAGLMKYLQEGNDYKKTEDVVKWLRENGPRVEVHSYGMEGKVSEARKALDDLAHRLDGTRIEGLRNPVNDSARHAFLNRVESGRQRWYPNLTDEQLANVREYDRLAGLVEKEDQFGRGPRATSAYETVSAFDTRQPMPEWTTSKEGKNVQRVDVVIPLKTTGAKIDKLKAEGYNGKSLEYEANRPYWQPDNLHENLPNTLGWAMIQYKTGPKGEKIAFIAEVQSRWGQERRESVQNRIKSLMRAGRSAEEAKRIVQEIDTTTVPDHPLLRDYNRLILKAAIEQAKKEGATHIVVSDAETAMMSEGHDTQDRYRTVGSHKTREEAEYQATQMRNEGYKIEVTQGDDGLWYVDKDNGIPQEPGMRLNYDNSYFIVDKEGNSLTSERFSTAEDAHSYAQSQHGLGLKPPTKYPSDWKGKKLPADYELVRGDLPSIAEELTGSKGERVSLGEHKNAFVEKSSYRGDTSRIQNLPDKLQRENLIFRNPDGTPKTDVSGMMYPIERTVARPTMLGKGTPESRYQPESALLKQTKTPEFKKWFGDSKVVDKDGKPLVVYHGTDKDFTVFDRSMVGKRFGNVFGSGFYFGEKPAKIYGKKSMPVFISLKNPIEATFDVRNPRAFADTWQKIEDGFAGKNQYDGAIIKELPGESGMQHGRTEYIVFRPEQIKSATSNIGTFDPNNPDIRYSIKSPLSPIRAEITKVREDFGPLGKIVAGDYDKGFQGFYEQKDLLTGELNGEGLLNPFLNKLNPVEWFVKRTNDDIETVGRKMLAESYGKKSNITLTPRQKEIEQVIRKNLLKSVALKNAEPNLRKTIADPNYYPQVPKDEVLNILLNKVGTPEYGKLRKDFYDYHKSIGTPDPEAKFKEFRAGYEKQEVSLASQFGPVDKSAGVGIPPSWAESSPTKVMPRFNNRYARRIAYERAINNHPDILTALDEIQGADVVKNVLQDIQGKTEYNEVWRNAAAGLVRAAMLGPLTGAKDFTSNLTLGLQHTNPLDLSRATIDALQNFKNNWKSSFETGVNRHNFGTLEIGDGGIDAVSSVLRRSRDIMNSIQGRNILELTNRTIAFGQGKFLAQIAIDAGKKSRLTGQQNKFLQDFAPDWKKAKVTDEYLNKVAGRYARSVQGSYDYRGLPALTQKGSLAPVLSLARWNVEKFNNFKQYVVEPAFKGNITPLLMSTLGMLIGGTAVQKLVEEVTGKKQRSPDWKEIAAVAGEPDAKVKEAIAYKLAVLASFSGYAGIMGDLVKSGMDVLNKNTPQTYGNPLLDGLANAGRLTGELVEALRDGNLDITADVLSQILEDYVQGYRLAINKVSPERQEKTEATNRRRDLRNWKNLTGQDVTTYSGERANPFMDKESREFKQTDDLGKALELLPGLVQNALEKSKGDPERLESELTKLKRNSYQLFPNPERTPGTFLKYLTYLQNSQGQEAAHEALMDYLMQTEINKVKSSLVPSL